MTQTTDRLAKVLRPVAVMHTHKTHLTEIEEYRNGSACLAPGDKAVGWKETLLYSEKDMQSLSTDLDKAQRQLVDAEQRLAMVEAENIAFAKAVVDLSDNITDWDGVAASSDIAVDLARAALNPQPTGKESGHE